MANRFVWSKNTINVVYNNQRETVRSATTENNVFLMANGFTESGGSFALVEPVTTGMPGYTYSILDENWEGKKNINRYMMTNGGPSSVLYEAKAYTSMEFGWKVESNVVSIDAIVPPVGRSDDFTKITRVPTNTKGDLTGYVSSASDGQYPADGVSGNSCFFEFPPLPSIAPRCKIDQNQPV